MLSVKEIHDQAMASPMVYDERLALAMTKEQHDQYQSKYGSTEPGHTYYVYLNALMRTLQPKNVLELGTSIGRSGLFMMLGLPPESRFTTIELGSYLRVDLQPFFDDPRLRIVFGSDLDESVYGPLGLKDVDFLFMDSEHSYEQVSKEWEIYKNFLIDGAVVVMDDIHLSPEMDKFWNEIKYDKVGGNLGLHFSGFGIFQYRR